MAQETTLHGWKAIAGYLGRDQRTALRWAAQRGLPVRRVPGGQRGPVFASTLDIDRWLQAERDAGPDMGTVDPVTPESHIGPAPPLTPAPARVRSPSRARLLGAVGLFAIVILALLFAATTTRPAAQPAPAGPAYTDHAAQTAFLQATFDWNLRTRESLARAVREYREAIAREPLVADGYVGLTNAYLLSRQYGSLDDRDAYAHAAEAARAALTLGPAGPDLHRALAFLAFWRAGDRATARREFALALQMRPNDALTHQWLATALSANGEGAAALREIAVARTLDPTSTSATMSQALLLYLAGERARSLDALRTLERDQPQNATIHAILGSLALAEGRPGEYLVEEMESARLRGDADRLAAVRRLAQAGPAAPSTIVEALVRRARATTPAMTGWYTRAQIEALAGHRAEALSALARSCGTGGAEAVPARSDVWLARSIGRQDIDRVCGPAPSLL